MNLKNSLIVGAVCCLIVLTGWEFYCRSQGYVPGLEDDKALWAVQRAKVETASQSDVVLLGSSRVLFDIQLDQWEEETGMRPIQLASAGCSPLPSFHDIVNNTDFKGTVVVGVTPGLFFSTTYPGAYPWNRIQTRIDYYFDQTYAQWLNHKLSIPLENNLAFLANDDENWSDDLNLKALMSGIKIGNRNNDPAPPFYRFQDIDKDRNVRMKDKTVQDTAFANSVIKNWIFFGSGAPPPDKKSTMEFFLQDYNKFKSRGGNIILLRCPSSAGVRMGESKGMPRKEFWDELIDASEAPAYHFEDYEKLNQFFCPEWSHLSREDAERFTTELTRILKKDQVIHSKNSDHAL